MQSILTADTEYLYAMMYEITSKLTSSIAVSDVEKEYMHTLQLQISTEFELRNAKMGYKTCFYHHKNGDCAAIGGKCTANGYGESLKKCQLYRETYIKTTKKH